VAVCNNCGKKGFFLKVNARGVCADCERNDMLIQQAAELHKNLKALSEEVSGQEEFKEKLIKEAQEEADRRLAAKTKESEELSRKIEILSSDVEIMSGKHEKAIKALATAQRKVQKTQALYKSMEYSMSKYFNQHIFDSDIIIPAIEDEIAEELGPTISVKLHCMDVKQLRQKYNQNYKLIKEVLAKYQDRYTTKANITIYKLMVIALEAELQNVLSSISYGKLDKAESAIKLICEKYQAIAADGNQSIAPTVSKFIGEVEYLFLQAVAIEYEYFIQKERIKEEQRAIREQMRQEAEERRRLAQQRKQVEKEESKYKAEIESVEAQLRAAEDDNKIQQLEARILQLREQLSGVEHKKEEITRLQNGQAGYVYVISNLGSFGEDVFKVGMTRRLEPQERVDELGSASVPFPFDVHSFIFSENAVFLENNMHKRLNDRRLNKVNMRKEFFKVSIDELEELVDELEPSAEFNRTMLAQQYNQSLSIDYAPEESDNIDLSDEDDGITECEDENEDLDAQSA